MFSTEELGFKKLSADNWSDPDPLWDLFYRADGPTRPLDEWVKESLAVHLNDSVPLQIRQLFEVARAAYVYGTMFYPLLTLGSEQMSRVAEAAVTLKCRLLKMPAKPTTFESKVAWLIKNGAIAPHDEQLWRSLRFHRNHGSHPKIQSIFLPEMGLETMELAAHAINKLF